MPACATDDGLSEIFTLTAGMFSSVSSVSTCRLGKPRHGHPRSAHGKVARQFPVKKDSCKVANGNYRCPRCFEEGFKEAKLNPYMPNFCQRIALTTLRVWLCQGQRGAKAIR